MSLVLIDAITSIFAFIGCLLYGISMLQYRRFDILARRTGYLIVCISAIFLTRFLLGVSEHEFFARALTFFPFCIPIFILVSVEGLIRRHAAQWLKILAFGSLGAGLVTLFYGVCVYWCSCLYACGFIDCLNLHFLRDLD